MSHAPSPTTRNGPSPADVGMPSRRVIPAWLLSAAVHFVTVITLCFVVRGAKHGADVEPDRSGGIVLVHQAPGKTEYLTEGDQESSSGASAKTPTANAVDPLPKASDLPLDVAGLLPSPQNLAGGVGDIGSVLPGADGLLSGAGASKKIGGQTQTGVFGVQGVGSKFVYVFDRSGSMEGFRGRPLAAAKRELIASLQSLTSTNQFQIIFYNERPQVFNPFPQRAPQLMFGTERDKDLAAGFVRSVVADGGTRHMDALKMALNMKPDVIFFLTDADEPQLSADDLADVQKWNRYAGASINTIEFGSGPYRGDYNFLVKLARQNGGQHVYVDVSQLPER